MAKGLAVVGGIALVGVFAGAGGIYQHATAETERFTVVDAFEVTSGDTREKRIQVITEDGCTETFKVEDSLWHWQWYSSNLHGVFADAVTTEGRQDNTFEATHYGWRAGFMSWMENVVSAERLEGAEPFVVRPDATTACRL